MTTLTPDLLNAVMAKQGAPNTTDNLNRIAEFAALHPGVLEQYIGKGTDAGTTGASINNSIAATDGATPRGPADPNGYVSTLDPNTGMTSTGPRLTKAPNIADPGRGGGGRAGPKPSPSRQGNYGPAWSTDAQPAAPPVGDDSLGVPWWLAPFAARALPKKPPGPGPSELPPKFNQGEVVPRTGPEAQYVGPMDRADPRMRLPPPPNAQLPYNPQSPTSAAPPPQITGNNAPTYPSGAPEITRNDINAATRGEAQKQVDAENERLLTEEMRRQNATAKPRTARPARPGIR